jgi:hypothetical protein
MKRLPAILLMATIFILSVGCTKENADIHSQEYFHRADFLGYSSDKNNKVESKDEFEDQLKNFHCFSQEFFSIWDDHVENIAALLEKFNDENTALNEKIIYSKMLLKEYEKLDDSLKQIMPPPEASKAYQYALDAISKRILFLKEFEKGASINELIEIENEAYIYELLFWEEMDNIYNYFDEESDKLGLLDDNESFLKI